MNKFFEVVKARSKSSSINTKLNNILMKTVENIAYERAGKTAPHNDADIIIGIEEIKGELKGVADSLSDEAALIATELFEEWNPYHSYAEGDRFLYNGNLYRCKASNPVNPTWTPDVVFDYYEPVAKPDESGTIDNPIVAVAGMLYEEGKHYSENGKIYRCTRTETLHFLPSALVGHYFEEVGETNG